MFLTKFLNPLILVFFVCERVSAASNDRVFPPQHQQQHKRTRPNQQRLREANQQRSAKSIPIDMIKKLNSITSETQLFEEFIEDSPIPMYSSGGGRLMSRADSGFVPVKRVGRVTDNRPPERDIDIESQLVFASWAGAGGSPRSARLMGGLDGHPRMTGDASTTEKSRAAVVPKFAACAPELRTVTLRDTDDSTLYYYPSCTRVERCGGCCAHDLLSCQQKSVQYVNYTVHVSKYVGKPKLEYRGTKQITVEKHLKCSCECKVKASDCTSQQQYEANDCRCVCTNKDEEDRCAAEEKIKFWNPSSCQCRCRQITECSSGHYFDENKCTCAKTQKPNSNFPPDYNFDPNRYG